MNIISVISLLRPLQWVKNVFIFIPLFFSGNLLSASMWLKAIVVFTCFSLVASGIYCLNDLKDIEADKLHPIKKFRPLASGQLPVATAVAIMIVLLIGGLGIAWFGLPHSRAAFLIIATYLVLNVTYCFKLKQIAIIDVFIVSLGFVFRILAGGLTCGIWISPWLICMTFLLALFLSFAKRRDDVVLMENKGIIVRKNIIGYNLNFLNQTLGIIGAMTMMSYIMYTVSPEVIARLGSDYVYISAIFVLAGILRYLQVALVDLKSGSPTKILMKDRFIQMTILCWLITFITIIYL
ncbi:MAG: decaprenyl-phosphate phosphoribosyltransferase [Lachnospiraceae bacterium]|nr:decaprenyl-phosphate phosphoribosyltransferase [Lachnospiraceae bacterium]